VVSITPLRTLCLAGVAAIASLAAPELANAGFSSQLVPIAGPVTGGNSGLRDIAVSKSGEAIVIWTEGGAQPVAIKARRIHRDGSQGAVIEITDGTTRAVAPEAEFAPNGRAIVAWFESPKFSDPVSLRTRWIEPDDTMTDPITVRAPGAESEPGELDLATTPDSNAILAWHNFKSKPLFRIVEAQYVTGGGALSELILPTSGAGSTHVQVAPTAADGSVMAWRDSSVEVQAFSPTGVPGSLQTAGPGVVADPELATDGSDHFQLVYKVGSLPSSVVYQPVAADGSFGAQQTLEPTVGQQISGISLATNQANRSVVAWDLRGTEQTVRTRFISGDGSPEATTFSTPAGPGNSAGPRAGIGGLGGAAVAWLQTPTTETGEIWGQIFPPGGEPGTPVNLSANVGVAGVPELGMGNDEVGLTAWDERLKSEGPEPSFELFARQILPSPSCQDASATVVQGRATRIPFACFGVQLTAPTIVSPPEHGVLRDIDSASQSVVYEPRPGYGGLDSFRFAGTNPGGAGPAQTARLNVGKDTIPPRITRFTIGQRRVPARRKRSGKVLRLRYSEVATATISIERGKRCGGVAGVSRRCKKFRKLGTLRANDADVSATVALPKRVGGKRLRPGRYRAIAVAKDPAGNSSQPKRLSFTIVPR
jgi:hypothetical protein